MGDTVFVVALREAGPRSLAYRDARAHVGECPDRSREYPCVLGEEPVIDRAFRIRRPVIAEVHMERVAVVIGVSGVARDAAGCI